MYLKIYFLLKYKNMLFFEFLNLFFNGNEEYCVWKRDIGKRFLIYLRFFKNKIVIFE